jgi:hypothetical protein
MRRLARSAAAGAALAAAAMIAGCGSATPSAPAPAAQASSPGAPFLATSLGTGTGTWAVAVMGGSAATEDNFWQLFVRPAGSSRWTLATPPGTADNGGLVLAATGRSVITAFRPSQYLTYTPLTSTGDGGQAWASTGPLDGALANVPDALADAPGTARLLALLADGTAEVAAPGYSSWKTLATQRSVAATPGGQHCRLQALTAAAFTPSGLPLLAGTCARPGTAGIFAGTGGTWNLAGPTLPTAVSRDPVAVLRLITIANQTVALLVAGTGHTASLLAAWSADNGRHWVLSSALPLDGAAPASASFSSAGETAVITASGQADVITGSGGQWRALPALPPGTATLAPGPGDAIDAMAVHRTTLTIWRLPPGSAAWTQAQTISVPVQYGTSG